MNGESGRRLWVVTECYPRPRAKTHCIFAHRQLTGVQAAGWQVSVLMPNGWFPRVFWRMARAWRVARDASVPSEFSLDGIPVRDLRYRNVVPNRFNRPREMTDLVALALDRHLRRVHATPATDVLMVQFALPFGPAVARAAARRGIPYVVHLRGDDVWVWPHTMRDGTRAFAETLRGASLVLAVSSAILTEARRVAGDHLPRSHVVANGIDLDLFRPPIAGERAALREELGLDPSQRVIICVGTAIHTKGWRELFAALGNVGSPAPALIAVMSGRGDLDLAALRDALCPEITMTRFHDVDAGTLARLYRAADVFCLPSHGEGLSNAVLEALASGLPVITTSVGGHPEVIDPGINGELVPARDVSALSEALGRVLDSSQRREQMGRAARVRAESIGTPAANGAKVATMLSTLVQAGAVAAQAQRSAYAAAGQS